VDTSSGPWLAAIAILGLVGGLTLLVRGFGAHRIAGRISDTSTSTITALAAGEVRVSGTVVAAELTLVSLLQSAPCVYYRCNIDAEGERFGDGGHVVEERSVGFQVRDASGSIRVFPRGARIDAPVRWDDKTGSLGDEPPGLQWRVEGAFALAQPDHAAAVADLLTVHDPGSASIVGLPSHRGQRHYREARLELGDDVTIVGQALPFSDLRDPAGADIGGELDPYTTGGDPEIAADLERARASGTLKTAPEDAWGNAAIPGFGIGRPTREPDLDPDANDLPIASAAEAERVERTFTIAPETLVLAATDAGLLITYGTPAAAAGREQSQFLVGLLGAVVSIASAMVLAVLFGGGSGL